MMIRSIASTLVTMIWLTPIRDHLRRLLQRILFSCHKQRKRPTPNPGLNSFRHFPSSRFSSPVSHTTTTISRYHLPSVFRLGSSSCARVSTKTIIYVFRTNIGSPRAPRIQTLRSIARLTKFEEIVSGGCGGFSNFVHKTKKKYFKLCPKIDDSLFPNCVMKS